MLISGSASLGKSMDYQSYKIFDPETEKIIEGLRVADCMNLEDVEAEHIKCDETKTLSSLKELTVSDVLTCSYCNVSFADANQQRSHYKLDWHRYNLKRDLSGNKSVPEDVFNTLTEDISSTSGSDSERGEDSESDPNESSKGFSLENFKSSHKSVRHAKVFFENNENKILSVYKCLLHSKKENPVRNELVKRVNDLIKQPKQWMIVLLGGGHFASAIFNNNEIICHKTFHCYTVRAKQGGSQSARDNKGGSHPKSAGASLRRYNEQALVQHVQEIIVSWSEPIKQCSLILYRATGPYNRGVLFGNKNPPLSKTDARLRNIPFPTRRATFKEVKRVYEILSSVEIYGAADNFKDRFPPNPDKRTCSLKLKKESVCQNQSKEEEQCGGEKDFTGLFNTEVSKDYLLSESTEDENDLELVYSDISIPFQNLQEYEDTVPEAIKALKRGDLRKKKSKKKPSGLQRTKLGKEKWNDEWERIQLNLIKSCESEDKELLIENLNTYAELPERRPDCVNKTELCSVFTKKDFIDCLNAPTNETNKNTVLHLVAIKGLSEFVPLLLESGADPTVKNKNKLTPYVIADKKTRNSFRLFAASFPEKYDFKKADIPLPLNGEKVKELEEKIKEKKKLKQIKEKIKKLEYREKKKEEDEKRKFLALSDKEKCALAAERRIIVANSKLKSAKAPVLSRCFQCGVDITGIVPFEYGHNRFCTIPCLKAHRLKNNSYGKEI